MSEYNPYEFDAIPAFAMQPARELNETQEESGFDPEIYEKLLAGFEPVKSEEPPEAGAMNDPEAGAMDAPEVSEQETKREAAGNPEVEAAEVQKEAEAELQRPDPEQPPVSQSEPLKAQSEPERNPEPAAKPEGTILSAADQLVTDSLRLVDMTACEPVRIYVEEDILVPDSKPDLASVLTMDGTLHFSERNGKISGDLTLQTLYVPQGKGADRSIVAIQSRLPFQQSAALTAGGDAADVKVSAAIESLDYSVVNERKFRVKATILAEGREYRNRRLELFQGLREDDVQTLRETLTVTDVIARKTERLEVEEDMMIPDALPPVGTVLRCDVDLVENHKQISRDKVVISGTAYCNIMYLPASQPAGAAGPMGTAPGEGGSAAMGARGTSDSDTLNIALGEAAAAPDRNPVLFQGKSEFTQFIPLTGTAEQATGGRVFFRKTRALVEPKESEGGQRNLLKLTLDAETFVELYRDVEQPVVTDAYHHQRELVFDTEEIRLMQLCPVGVAETAVREVAAIPETCDGVDRVAFLSGELSRVTSKIEGTRNVVEGLAVVKLVCLAGDEGATPFSLRRELPFRVAMDLPPGMTDAATDNETILKEVRFDKLNDRQIELTATVLVNGAVVGNQRCPLIRNVGFLERTGPEQERPGFVLYITRSGDTLWKIARRYRTTIDTLARINQIDGTTALKPGTKLLVVK